MRRYQVLREHEEAPALPTGYAGMILLAHVPPLWRRVMDPRVLAHHGGDVTLANVHPPARARLERRWGADAGASRATASTTPPPRDAVDDAVRASPHVRDAHSAGEVRVATCPGCGYRYAVADGAPREGFAPWTPWSEVPGSWDCPDCGVRTADEFLLDTTPAV